MKTILDDFTHVQGGCDRPELFGRLYSYLDDPINEPAAEEIEDHLLDCRDCREFFLTTLNLRRAARNFGVADGDEIPDSADVVTISEFGKEYP
jgi:putative zinc finger protein